MERNVGSIGQSVFITGGLSAKEDLTIEGQIEGKVVELDQNVLTIGPNGRIRAKVQAKVVIVMGKVTGNISATEKIEIGEKASVEGDLTAPRVGIADGAHFKGQIDMRRAETKPVSGVPAGPRSVVEASR